MTRVDVPLARFETVAYDHPRRMNEPLFAYLERLAVLAGAMEPGTGMLAKDHDWSSLEAGAWRPVPAPEVRMPYRDSDERT